MTTPTARRAARALDLTRVINGNHALLHIGDLTLLSTRVLASNPGDAQAWAGRGRPLQLAARLTAAAARQREQAWHVEENRCGLVDLAAARARQWRQLCHSARLSAGAAYWPMALAKARRRREAT